MYIFVCRITIMCKVAFLSYYQIFIKKIYFLSKRYKSIMEAEIKTRL